MKKAVIDRIVDGKHAVLLVGENEKEKIVSLETLPLGAKEGMWLKAIIDGDNIEIIGLDDIQIKSVEENIASKMNKLKVQKKSKFRS